MGRLIARIVIGGLFVAHGLQKLLGWFGGPGREGTEQMTENLDLRPARANALLVGSTETVGGTLVAVGAATPLAATGLIGTMITAIRKVHLANGPWASNGGYEYNLTLVAALVALVEAGPGPLSVDHALGSERTGPRWALGSLAAGAAASTAVIAVGSRWPAPDPAPAPDLGSGAGSTTAPSAAADGGDEGSAGADSSRAPGTERADSAMAAPAPTSPGAASAGDDPAGRSRQQLYEEARRLGIAGRSKMTKAELARAIAGAQA